MARSPKSTNLSATSGLTVFYPAAAGEPLRFAANELADSLATMLDERVAVALDSGLPQRHLRLAAPTLGASRVAAAAAPPQPTAGSDGFALWREAVAPSSPDVGVQPGAILLAGGTDRAVIHAVYELLADLGMRFPVGGPRAFPHVGRAALDLVESRATEPAFSRRAFVSDIMTWHYERPARLESHLEHDRRFISWMGAKGLNAFSYIRNAVDSRLKIDELVPLLRVRGIRSEYGGHVLQSLLPRATFASRSELFPVNARGERDITGNLCTSNAEALRIVVEGALQYLRDNPECELLHVWGADVWKGAWCRCGGCAALSPQLQYLRVVNAIGEAIATDLPGGPPVTYLAYHDTIKPDADLRPGSNVFFEWAPRQRCYSHAIDDAACDVNPRYFESLKCYIESFQGRGHVFEYYADAILFGGLACATPGVIARDLRAYRALGVSSIACLTFGQHSVISYPVNLAAFARGTRSPDFDPDRVLTDSVAALYPACAPRMAQAYRAIADASRLILDGGGDVMRPWLKSGPIAQRLRDLRLAHSSICRAVDAADHLVASAGAAVAAAERSVWHYSREVVSGIAEYLKTMEESGPEQPLRVDNAIRQIGAALDGLRASGPSAGDTWACWDTEWIGEIWVSALRRRFDEPGENGQENL